MSGQRPEEFSFNFIRPEDQIYLTFEFYNLHRKKEQGTGKNIIVRQQDGPAYITVKFPGQHIAEEVSPEFSKAKALISGNSQLVFELPYEVETLYFNPSHILDWNQLNLLISSEVKPVDPRTGRYTYIEFPYGLFLSPLQNTAWRHSLKPATRKQLDKEMGDRGKLPGISEIWHTVLETLDGSHANKLKPIWSLNYPEGTEPALADPIDTALNSEERADIVKRGTPHQINRELIILSSMGASSNIQWEWNIGQDLSNTESSLLGWAQNTAIGRDNEVRVSRGYSGFPLGAIFTVENLKERRINRETQITSLEFRRALQGIQSRIQTADKPFPNNGRAFPFSEYRVTCPTVNNLTFSPVEGVGVSEDRIGWPLENGKEVLFQVECIPFGNEAATLSSIHFQMPLIFIQIDEDILQYKQQIEKAYWEKLKDFPIELNGQSVCFAPASGSSSADNTSLITNSLLINGDFLDGVLPPGAAYVPRLYKSHVSSASLSVLTGEQKYFYIRYSKDYLEKGFRPEIHGIFAELTSPYKDDSDYSGQAETASNPETVNLGADKLGLASPNYNLKYLSREIGPIGGTVKDGKYNIEGFFQENASLFGGLSLKALLEISGNVSLDDLPKISYELVLPEKMSIKYEFTREINKDLLPLVRLRKNESDPQSEPLPIGLDLKIDISRDLSTSEPGQYTINGLITNFGFDFLSLIRLDVKSLKFHQEKDKKPEIDFDVDKIRFLNELCFLEALREYLPRKFNGFTLDLNPESIALSFSQALPSVNFGVFSLSGIRFGTDFSIPYFDKPYAFTFTFSQRYHPFSIFVSGFGGGGYLKTTLKLINRKLNTGDIVLPLFIEGTLEFGGKLDINIINLARGTAELQAGLFYKLENNKFALMGYVRGGANLNILGLIDFSGTFLIGLRYEDNSVYGSVKVLVSIDMWLFSTTVGLTFEQKFSTVSLLSNSSSVGHQDFGDVMTLEDWKDYTNAFIPVRSVVTV